MSRRRFFESCLMALPLIYLVADFIHVPVILNQCAAYGGQITLRQLVESQRVPLGSYIGHEFSVSLDAIGEEKYLDYLKDGPTALAVGIDHDDPGRPVWGAPIRAVLAKLDSHSPVDAAELRKVITGAEPSSGHMIVMTLPGFESLPVSYLYVLGIKAIDNGDGTSKQRQTEFFRSALKEVMIDAQDRGIANLVIPTIGVDPKDGKTLQFADIFPAIMESAELGRKPKEIQLSIFQNWPDDYRSSALDAVRRAWAGICSAAGDQSLLVRESLRLTMVALFICLMVSSAHVAITLKNFAIITVAFVGAAFGATEVLSPFLTGWGAAYRLAITVAVLAFLALAFPYLPQWNPQDIFDRKRHG